MCSLGNEKASNSTLSHFFWPNRNRAAYKDKNHKIVHLLYGYEKKKKIVKKCFCMHVEKGARRANRGKRPERTKERERLIARDSISP